MKKLELAEHPRLYVGVEEMGRLERTAGLEVLAGAGEAAGRAAEEAVGRVAIEFDQTTHNSLLIRCGYAKSRAGAAGAVGGGAGGAAGQAERAGSDVDVVGPGFPGPGSMSQFSIGIWHFYSFKRRIYKNGFSTF